MMLFLTVLIVAAFGFGVIIGAALAHVAGDELGDDDR